ncbi:hypothetical protein Cni_G07003 [Canna indica]|uniref:Myb/SANT-like domain-containing protein n=1 Tax=Canna indica TaxID=4628 RepID=A0AAQ3JZK8_9LILI|nr:hypothetical protein Cni_G07003 [Canna indica]
MEKTLMEKCPNSGLKANPHLDSKMRKWKKDYGIIYDMMNTSGFAWNDEKKCIEFDSDEINKVAEGWRRKSYPIFNRLAYIFGKDRATGKGAQGPTKMAEAADKEEENRTVIDVEESSPLAPNRSLDTTCRSKKREKSSDDVEDAILLRFENMFEKSIEHLDKMVDKLVKDNDDHIDISDGLLCDFLMKTMLTFFKQ